ncbi:hypothetical protein V2G26_013974 [Clonostachys chloroleuca]
MLFYRYIIQVQKDVSGGPASGPRDQHASGPGEPWSINVFWFASWGVFALRSSNSSELGTMIDVSEVLLRLPTHRTQPGQQWTLSREPEASCCALKSLESP